MSEANKLIVSGWLYKWTNYVRGYQKRWFVIQNGLLSYYRNQAEMAHTCRGTINLANALIWNYDPCTFVIRNSISQTFHLRANSEVERQRWVTALELAKSKSLHLQDSVYVFEEDSDDPESVHVEPCLLNGVEEGDCLLQRLRSKLEDLETCEKLVSERGDFLLEELRELENMISANDVTKQNRSLNENATMFKITTGAMIQACREFEEMAHGQKSTWERIFYRTRDSKNKLEDMLEQLAKQLATLENKAACQQQKQQQQQISGDNLGGCKLGFAKADNTASTKPALSNLSNNSSSSDGSTNMESASQSCNVQNMGSSTSLYDDEDEFYEAVEEPFNESFVVSISNRAEEYESDATESKDGCTADKGLLVNQCTNGASEQSVGKSSRSRRTSIPQRPNYSLNLWSIMKNCIGKDLSKIPMPVNFSEPLSFLQRLTEDMEYADCLDKAALCPDQWEEMAYVAAFTTSSYSTTTVRTGKPFNPLLGETFEMDRTEDLGWRCITEQVCHHPPTAALHCEGKGWTCWQEFTMSSKFRGKYLQIIPLGVAHLRFHRSGNHYTWRKVLSTVHNIIVGRLWIDNHGEMDIKNHTTGDNCHLNYRPYSYFSRERQRKVTGVITDVNSKMKYVLEGNWDESLSGAKVLNVTQKKSDGSGTPVVETAAVKVLWRRSKPPPGSELMYNFTQMAIELNEPEENVSPTDSRLRPDQRLMENCLWDEANKEKLRLEEKQRAARRHREQLIEEAMKEGRSPPIYKPVWFDQEDDPQTGGKIFVFNKRYWDCKVRADWSQCSDIFGDGMSNSPLAEKSFSSS